MTGQSFITPQQFADLVVTHKYRFAARVEDLAQYYKMFLARLTDTASAVLMMFHAHTDAEAKACAVKVLQLRYRHCVYVYGVFNKLETSKEEAYDRYENRMISLDQNTSIPNGTPTTIDNNQAVPIGTPQLG
jgi:hypothetical protein